jgi:hypothetical protein
MLCGQNAVFKYVKAGGTYSYRWGLKGCYLPSRELARNQALDRS